MDRLALFSVSDPISSVDSIQFGEQAAARQLRPEWSWFAEDGSTIVARGLWWGRQNSERPLTLDCLHVLPGVSNRAALATQLMVRAHREFDTRPDYQLKVPTSAPERNPAVEWRSKAANDAGLTRVVKRLQFEWIPASGIVADSGRLVFRAGSDREFLDAFRQVAFDSLDVNTQEQLAVMDPDSQAHSELEFYRSCPGERSWWRLAETTNGQLVGFSIPSATPANRNVGYLGVVPEQRGHGYVDDVLAEITRFHTADGVDRITATTDDVNTPMAAAFHRANYRRTETRWVFSAPAS
jgi:RimJ/RimL family protein N-acetyltransferase